MCDLTICVVVFTGKSNTKKENEGDKMKKEGEEKRKMNKCD